MFDEIVNDEPDFSYIKNSATTYEGTRALLKEKAEIYSKSNSKGDINFDLKIKEIAKEKEKIKKDSDGKEDRTRYNVKVEELSKVTGLSEKDIERLVAVETNLTDISTGKALELLTVGFLGSSPKYKDKLPYDVIKKLIETDSGAQDAFKEKLKDDKKRQTATDKLIKEGVVDNRLSPDLEVLLTKNQAGVLMSDESKQLLRDGVDNKGVSLDRQKEKFYKILFDDLAEAGKKSVAKDSGAITNRRGVRTDPSLDFEATPMGKLISALKIASVEGKGSVLKVLDTFTDIQLAPAIDENVNVAYILSTIASVASSNEPSIFLKKHYDRGAENINNRTEALKKFTAYNFIQLLQYFKLQILF